MLAFRGVRYLFALKVCFLAKSRRFFLSEFLPVRLAEDFNRKDMIRFTSILEMVVNMSFGILPELYQ